MKWRIADIYLNLIAGVIALSILALSVMSLWADRQKAWHEAEQSSRNLLTAITRDLGNQFSLLDLSLKGVARDLGDETLLLLPPELRHRLLFDRATVENHIGTILVLNEAGDVVQDSGSSTPRSANLADQDYFTVHKEHAEVGLYLSRPHKTHQGNGDYKITISRRLSHPDGRFAGIVMGAVPLAKVHELFKNLNVGWGGSITLFRADGVVLVREPYKESEVGLDMRHSPSAQRFVQEGSGSFQGQSPLDGIHRLYTFGRVDSLPLILSVSLSVEEILAAWEQKAVIQGVVTAMLCSAVVSLTFLFQRELTRRTRAETKLRRIARTDDLTGLPNRRAFRETFEREWRQAIRSGSSLSLLFVDADFFKAYNDHYGHGAGDQLLREIAGTLYANIRRPRDTAARYGGEEFIILLPETDQAGAWTIAENIRQAIMAMSVSHERSPYRLVTVSIGIATASPSRGSAGSILLEAADAALYQAKASGRNCICTPASELPSAVA